jgi:hypothetical protein
LNTKKNVQDFDNVLKTEKLPYNNRTKQSEGKARKGEWFQLFLDFSSKTNSKPKTWENRLKVDD